MSDKIIKILDFCNLLDYNKKLSVTNVALLVLLGKILVAASIDWPSIVALIGTLANYAHKREVNDRS